MEKSYGKQKAKRYAAQVSSYPPKPFAKRNTRSKNVKYLKFEGLSPLVCFHAATFTTFQHKIYHSFISFCACSNGAMHAHNTKEKEMKSSEFTKAQVIDKAETRDSVICKLKDIAVMMRRLLRELSAKYTLCTDVADRY